MQIDSFFSIGKSHSVCEDYAFHGDDCIIISDGCSSSKHTDVGSRLLSLTAHRILKTFSGKPFSYSEFGNRVATCVAEQLRLLDLPISAMDATLLVSFINDNQIYTYIYGDGQYQIKHKDGKIQYGTLNYNSNAPYYLSYWLNPQRHIDYIDNFGSDVEYLRGTLNVDSFNVESGDIDIEYHKTESIVPSFPIDEIEYVLLMSDGVESFQDYNVHPPVPISDTKVRNDISAFKNTKGEFITRRLKAALKKFKKQGIEHYDDLSVAGMYFDGSQK